MNRKRSNVLCNEDLEVFFHNKGMKTLPSLIVLSISTPRADDITNDSNTKTDDDNDCLPPPPPSSPSSYSETKLIHMHFKKRCLYHWSDSNNTIHYNNNSNNG